MPLLFSWMIQKTIFENHFNKDKEEKKGKKGFKGKYQKLKYGIS